MAKIRLTKEFSFESAHALDGYEGACREIHGHSYRLLVTVRGCPSTEGGASDEGMVMDFGELKRIVTQQVVARMDHAFVMQRSEPNLRLAEALGGRFSRIEMTDYRPTCENMLSDFAARIGRELPCGVELHSLRLHETATSYAEWFAEDNLR